MKEISPLDREEVKILMNTISEAIKKASNDPELMYQQRQKFLRSIEEYKEALQDGDDGLDTYVV